MKKVGIMSMQRIANYGSFLQAYALKQLIEETVNDVIDDEISEILKEKQGSYLEDLDIDTIRKEYRELFIHSAWYMLLRRCGIEPGDYMYLEDFRAITDFNNILSLIHI